MSIKLSIKDLKDLLKANKQAIKKRRRKRNKRLIKNSNDVNYNKSSSDHMKSIGFTNTSNEATELIRLQRQALEDKLKSDRENKIKSDDIAAVVPYNPLQNAGGSSDLRRDVKSLHHTVNYMMMGMDGSTMWMPRQGKPGPEEERGNVGFVDDGPKIEEIKTSQGAVFAPDDEDEETTVSFTPAPVPTTTPAPVPTTTPASKKKSPSMKNLFGMLTPTVKEEEKQAANDPSKTLASIPESTKKPKKDVTIKDAAVGETEQQFDLNTLDIESKKTLKPQLIAFINLKRDTTDGKLIKLNKPELQDIARAIKAEEAAAKRKAARAAKVAKASGVVI